MQIKSVEFSQTVKVDPAVTPAVLTESMRKVAKREVEILNTIQQHTSICCKFKSVVTLLSIFQGEQAGISGRKSKHLSHSKHEDQGGGDEQTVRPESLYSAPQRT
jgi:hypothetical protein